MVTWCISIIDISWFLMHIDYLYWISFFPPSFFRLLPKKIIRNGRESIAISNLMSCWNMKAVCMVEYYPILMITLYLCYCRLCFWIIALHRVIWVFMYNYIVLASVFKLVYNEENKHHYLLVNDSVSRSWTGAANYAAQFGLGVCS